MEEQQAYLDIKRARRNLVLGLIAAIAAIDGAVFFTAGSEIEAIVSDISRVGTVCAAAALSLVVVRRQKVGGLFGRAYAALAAGLMLWVVAESIWAYYELGLGIGAHTTSIADVFWISGYGPFAYHLLSTARFFGKGLKRSAIAIVGVAAALFLAFYIQTLVGVFELEGPGALATLAISIVYPVLDALLIVPAVLIVMNAGKGQLTSIPWIFIGWILLVLADSMLGVAAASDMSEVFHITMAYNAAYLCFAAGLLWYNRQFIISDKKLVNW
ncbi:hypothetical protein Ngar_c24840 [Candidatus Nitrososphaera gargensis Ga9.2]|uniref:Uncharacterized protein n=1 Tax=Nitrososphaera gargensis (strain Ga9.2) TaxID=1237085 RepID=K0IDD7_NITGG|nr:hypothetical protein [Candidatus Nitrososphaera gargensis]AFU59406.1 hypothetical protein Ngar_c24840 [Candidatus Nitrososphaera gargensis Ga9.2]